MNEAKALLIGGTSHVGKSTLAQTLALRLGWDYLSTDSLARHPGRPWKTTNKTVPPHVVAHYSLLSVEELLADVLRHYESLWPTVTSTITSFVEQPTAHGLVVEGSALWPDQVATFPSLAKGTRAVWLTAGDALITQRIYANSLFSAVQDQEREVIQKFLRRTLLYNWQMMKSVQRLGLNSITVEETTEPEELVTVCLKMLDKQQ